MTDRETARLVALLREAANALRPLATFDATLPARLRLTADELVRDAYTLPNAPESPDSSENTDRRDDRRDHDRYPALSL